jgi:hypothetical protein
VSAASIRATISAFMNGHQNFLSSILLLKIMHQIESETWALGMIRLVQTERWPWGLIRMEILIGPILRTTSPEEAGILKR